MKNLKILNIEDSSDDSALILRHFTKSGYEVFMDRIETPQAMRAALAGGGWDVIISDYRMPNFSGLEAYAVLKESGLDIPFIIISGTIGEETAVEAMLAGVNDYMMKNNLSRLVPAIEREMQETANRRARREAEEALRESEKRLQLALSAARMGVWEWNPQTNVVICSEECYQLAGIDTFGGTFEDFAAFLPPDQLKHFTETVDRAIAENILFEVEFQLNKPCGETIWLSNHGKIDYDENGQAVRMVCAVTDVTDRKKAEEELRQSEERFRSLTSAISQIVWTADADGVFLSARSPRDELTLVDNDVMTEWETRLHSDDRERAINNFRQAIRNRSRYQDEFRLRHVDDNTYHYYISRGTPVFEKDGTIREWVGSLTDITGRKLAEKSLRESEENFRALVKATTQFVWMVDTEGESPDFPHWWSEITGMTPEQSRGGGWMERLHADDRERTARLWQTAFENKTLFEVEYRVLSRENEYRHFAVRGVPVFNDDSSFRQWIGTFTDITERVIADETLRRTEDDLRQSQKLESVGRLAGGIAHDFNNMLTAINGYSDLTLRRLSPEDPLRGNIEEIRKAGERSAELTHQLLAFSRQQILQEKVLDINDVIVDTSMMLERLIGEDIKLITSLAPDIGKIKADPGQLSQVVLNLVVNSRDAMANGGKITIETMNVELDEAYASQHRSVIPGPYVMMAVSDTGTGIDSETMERMFEPFFTTKGKGKGTGLGLSTVYGIIKQSGGNIWVYTELEEGTTFKIYFPLIHETAGTAEKAHPGTILERGTETILLVEDEEILRRLGREILEAAGYNVLEAKDGVDALDICEQRNGKIDLLLTDVVMPQMGGRELAEKLAPKYPKMRVLFTSGYTDDAIVRHGIIDEGTNFIQKPFTLEALSGKVRETLDAKR